MLITKSSCVCIQLFKSVARKFKHGRPKLWKTVNVHRDLNMWGGGGGDMRDIAPFLKQILCYLASSFHFSGNYSRFHYE